MDTNEDKRDDTIGQRGGKLVEKYRKSARLQYIEGKRA